MRIRDAFLAAFFLIEPPSFIFLAFLRRNIFQQRALEKSFEKIYFVSFLLVARVVQFAVRQISFFDERGERGFVRVQIVFTVPNFRDDFIFGGVGVFFIFRIFQGSVITNAVNLTFGDLRRFVVVRLAAPDALTFESFVSRHSAKNFNLI